MRTVKEAVFEECGKGSARVTVYEDAAFSKINCETSRELTIATGDDWVEIILTEYRFESNRSVGVSINMTRNEWNALKRIVSDTGGVI